MDFVKREAKKKGKEKRVLDDKDFKIGQKSNTISKSSLKSLKSTSNRNQTNSRPMKHTDWCNCFYWLKKWSIYIASAEKKIYKVHPYG